MSFESKADALNQLKEANKRLSEDLNFERNLNNILENIRNNSMILIQNCKCLTNQKTLRVIKQFNSIYTNLKTKQNLLKLNENQNQISVTKINLIDENKANLKTNSTIKTFHQKSGKVKYEEIRQSTEDITNDSNKNNLEENKSKFSLITEILNLKNKNREQKKVTTNQLTIIELTDHNSDTNMESNTDHKTHDFNYENNNLVEFIECQPSFDSIYSDNSQSEEVDNSQMLIDTNDHQLNSSGVCHICKEYSGDNKEQLLKHLANRHKIPSFECDLCEFKTFTDNRLLKHKKIHSTDNPFVCDVDGCDQTFRTEYKMSLHKMQNHSTDRRFSCHLCDYKASKKWNLDGHMSVHSVQKSIKCPFDGCDKWFANRHRLYEHKLYKHSPKRFERFTCDWPQCQKVFRQKKTLKRHKKNVHSVE